MLYPAFFGGSYEALSPIAMARRTVNFYLEKIESPGAEFPAALNPTPGWESFVSVVDGPVRGVFYQNGRAFMVAGTKFIEIFANGTTVEHGTVIQTGTEPATITSNGDGGGELLITVDGHAYLFDLATNTLTQITALNNAAHFGGMLDGFFIALNTDESEIRISNLFDGSTWDPVLFEQRAAAPDRWKSMLVSGSFIWLFGEETSEPWYNAGRPTFPFAVDKSGVIPVGIGAPHSAADLGGQVIWLARTKDGDKQIVKGGSGGYPQRISNYALENTLDEIERQAGETAIRTAVGESFQWLGHWFYLLTFPQAPNGGQSWLYDLSSDTWSQVGTWNAPLNRFDAWAPLYHMFAFGRHLFGSRTSGAVWQAKKPVAGLNPEGLLDTNGEPVRRVHRPPSLRVENKVMYFPRVELLLETGLAITGQLPHPPMVSLFYSNDGGKTWNSGGQVNAGQRSASEQGQYLLRVYWTRLGSGRQRIHEWVFSDPVPWRIAGAYIDMYAGTEGRAA